MTDDIKKKIEADTKKYRAALQKFATDYIMPVLQSISN